MGAHELQLCREANESDLSRNAEVISARYWYISLRKETMTGF